MERSYAKMASLKTIVAQYVYMHRITIFNPLKIKTKKAHKKNGNLFFIEKKKFLSET